MIQIIRQICHNAGCQPKDLVVEWSPSKGARVVGTNRRGEKTYMNVLARLDRIAQAIWLCANGQENLYPQIQQQQTEIDAKIREWLADNSGPFRQDFGNDQQGNPAKGAGTTVLEDWRQCDSVAEIIRAFPTHPSTDDIIDLYQRNKSLKSSDLKSLVEKHSRKTRG